MPLEIYKALLTTAEASRQLVSIHVRMTDFFEMVESGQRDAVSYSRTVLSTLLQDSLTLSPHLDLPATWVRKTGLSRLLL